MESDKLRKRKQEERPVEINPGSESVRHLAPTYLYVYFEIRGDRGEVENSTKTGKRSIIGRINFSYTYTYMYSYSYSNENAIALVIGHADPELGVSAGRDQSREG